MPGVNPPRQGSSSYDIGRPGRLIDSAPETRGSPLVRHDSAVIRLRCLGLKASVGLPWH
jgi:hypothetical protein